MQLVRLQIYCIINYVRQLTVTSTGKSMKQEKNLINYLLSSGTPSTQSCMSAIPGAFEAVQRTLNKPPAST